MTTLLTFFTKFFNPGMLAFPSPVLEWPANWLVPLILWLAIFKYVAVKVIGVRQLKQIWRTCKTAAAALRSRLNQELTYPEVHPLRNILLNLVQSIISYILGFYFGMLGMVTSLLAIVANAPLLNRIGLLVFGLAFIGLLARYYTIQGAKLRIETQNGWNNYPNKSWMAKLAIVGTSSVVVVASIFVSFLQPA